MVTSCILLLQYDLFVINLVLRLLRNEYPEYDTPDHVAGMSLHALEGGVAAAALLGSIIGQLVAGKFLQYIFFVCLFLYMIKVYIFIHY